MLVSIGGYSLCDGTLAGGVALSDLNFNVNRTFDLIDPLQQAAPVALNRTNRMIDVTFIVRRTLNSIGDAEKFILNLEDIIPQSGPIVITAGWVSPSPATIPNGVLLSHSLVLHNGSLMFHQYRIAGGPIT